MAEDSFFCAVEMLRIIIIICPIAIAICMQYNPYLWPNCRNLRVLKEIGVEEHNGGVASYFRLEVQI